MAKNQIRQYVFTPGAAGVGTIVVPGRVPLESIQLITNTTRNTIIYNFADPTFSGTTATFSAANTSAFPTITQRADGVTTITLATSTVGQSANDRLQIFTETQDVSFRPFQFGTDAIERMRVSNPQSVIDADFEYGLQPTKWAGFGTMRGYPSAFDQVGVDLSVTAITTDWTTTSASNSTITITFGSAHGLSAGQVVNVINLNRSISGYSRADGNFVIASAPSGTQITYLARGVVGTANGQSLFTSQSVVKRANFYSGASIPVSSATSNGASPSTITLNFTAAHGLLPGTPIHVNVASGANAALATGPFVVLSVPSTTSLTYLARAGGAVTTPATITLYAMSNIAIYHRPFDGGVIISSRSPTYGAIVARQSKRYFRYQSGKGFLWSSGTLMRPNYDIQSITASGTIAGSTITVNLDDIDHGLQVGATIQLTGVTTSGYNGTYTVASIVNDSSFTVTAGTALGATTAVLDIDARCFVTGWHGSAVRAGVFDDQNGIFWEYDGANLCAVRRSATTQIVGTVSVTADSTTVTGTNTRFTTQLKVGDRLVIRGMTHYVNLITNDTSMTITPDYRGTTASGVKATLVRETRILQSQFNIDRLDGTGPSGFTFDPSRMQMIGIQYTWYGAGFIDFMMRGSDGNWVYAHRIKNNNVNNEAYMRSGNLPVRYSVENETAASTLTASMTNSQNTVPVAELTFFPSSGTVLIDNELISYSGKSASTGAGNLTGATRAATLSQYFAGTTNSLTAGAAATHNQNVGVILVSNTCSPTLSHWGSALVMDGGFDQDRGYIFNYQRLGVSLTTTAVTAFAIRLAPSVDNGTVGALGARDLLNRSQLLLQAVGVAVSAGTNPGAVIVEGILNPRNFSSATWNALSPESAGGQPSLAQVADSITWTTGSVAVPGEQVFAFAGPTATSGAVNDRLDLTELKELTGAPLGGNNAYPDGSDILAINVRLTAGTATGHILLRWSEAQA